MKRAARVKRSARENGAIVGTSTEWRTIREVWAAIPGERVPSPTKISRQLLVLAAGGKIEMRVAERGPYEFRRKAG